MLCFVHSGLFVVTRTASGSAADVLLWMRMRRKAAERSLGELIAPSPVVNILHLCVDISEQLLSILM